MPSFSPFGRSRLDWPIYNGKAAPPDFSSRQAICAYPKTLFRIFINPAFYRSGKIQKVMVDGFHFEGLLNRIKRSAFQQKGKSEFNKMIFINTAFG
tara:strand:- start:424 stop:711 length:288 start_codon:yes stop_codon:yes gene_type:complete